MEEIWVISFRYHDGQGWSEQTSELKPTKQKTAEVVR